MKGQSDNSRKKRKGRFPEKTAEGRPLSLECVTGSNTFHPWPQRQRGKKTDAVVRNEVEMLDILNIPQNFHWTDVPFLPRERPKFEGIICTSSSSFESVRNDQKFRRTRADEF